MLRFARCRFLGLLNEKNWLNHKNSTFTRWVNSLSEVNYSHILRGTPLYFWFSGTVISEFHTYNKKLSMSSPCELNTGPLDAETKSIAEKELRETPEVVQKAFTELRELLKNDNSIYFKDSDEYLTIFLRPCKWYAQSAYELMKRIADFKVKHKAILENLMPEDEKVAFTEHNIVNVMSNLDHKGRRVLILNVGESWDPSKVNSDQIFRLLYLVHEMAVLEPNSQVRGVVVIMDYNRLGMKQICGIGPSYALLLMTFLQEAIPLRIKEVHMVNEPMIFYMVWQLLKPLLQPKLKARMFFHGTKMESLHKYLNPSHLPKNYGGELPEIDYSGKDWYAVIQKYEDHIRLMNRFGRTKQ